jgi:hypothetical protein
MLLTTLEAAAAVAAAFACILCLSAVRNSTFCNTVTMTLPGIRHVLVLANNEARPHVRAEGYSMERDMLVEEKNKECRMIL